MFVDLVKNIKKLYHIFRYNNKPWHRVCGAVFMRLPFDIGKIIRITIRVQDYYIRLHSSSLSVAFWCNPSGRTPDYTFITNYLKTNDIYIDVGANIGTTLIPAAKKVNGGKVIGFEPHPRIFSYLEENVLLNDLKSNVSLHNCALGSEQGMLLFSSRRADDMNRLLLKGRGIEVPVKLLDDFGGELSNIALMKIDVEGYEKFVIEGGIKTLEKTQCIYFEISNEHCDMYGYSLKELLVLLEKMGFNLFIKAGDRRLSPMRCDYKLSVHHTDAFAIRNLENFTKRTGWEICDV